MAGETMGGARVLYAPWRERYLRAMAEAERGAAGLAGGVPAVEGGTGCFLRDYWLAPQQDAANLVVLRRSDEEAGGAGCGGLVMLNLYPYANGHMLVALGEGRGRVMEYSSAQRAALWGLVEDAMLIMDRGLGPQGINVGINEGRAAGAGVPQHVHVHLVPRWHGDVNFMTVAGGVRVHPSAPAEMARRYREAWEAIRAERGKGG